MGECNSCGACCHPLLIDRDKFELMLRFAEAPDPDSPEFAAWKAAELPKTDLSDPANREHLERHLANGRFAKRHWLPNIRFAGAQQVEIRCPHYSVGKRMCKAYDNRPPICADYPWYDRPEGDPHALKFKECSYWEDVDPEHRPEGWVLITEVEIRSRK